MLKEHKVFGPKKFDERRLFAKISNPEEILLDGFLTEYPPKNIVLPPREVLLKYKDSKYAENETKSEKIAVLGITPVDLKSLVLYDHVFEKDVYYQNRKERTLIVGQSLVSADENTEYKRFEELYEEQVLEHLRFDIFLERKKDSFNVFSGSSKGKDILEEIHITDFEHVEFAGPIKEEGKDSEMVILMERLKKKYPSELFKELGERCLECGKCAIVCPTCFCYRKDDCPSLASGRGKIVRCMDTCFYHDFSEIAGGFKFLDNTEKRIYNWYEHKFVRIPSEFSLPGCVKCGRCTKTCPVGIDINENIEKIKK